MNSNEPARCRCCHSPRVRVRVRVRVRARVGVIPQNVGPVAMGQMDALSAVAQRPRVLLVNAVHA